MSGNALPKVPASAQNQAIIDGLKRRLPIAEKYEVTYHAGIMEGNIIEDIRSGIDAVGHFHIAAIPGRHEPKAGEQNYSFICRAIDKTGFKGYIGLEYWPLKPAEESLRETANWLTESSQN